MKYDREEYLSWNYFEGEDADIQCRTTKLVKVRKPQKYFGGMAPGGDNHVINPGSTALFEKGLIDRSFWGTYYFCTSCMDKYLDELNGVDDTEQENEND